MANACSVLTQLNSDEIAKHIAHFRAKTDTYMNNMFGTREAFVAMVDNSGANAEVKQAAKIAYDSTRALVMDAALTELAKLNYDTTNWDLGTLFSQLSYLSQRYFGHPLSPQTITGSGPNRMIAFYQRLTDIYKKRDDFKINPVEKAFLPLLAYAMKGDQNGRMYRFAKEVTGIHGKVEMQVAKIKQDIVQANNALVNHLANTFSRQVIKPEEYEEIIGKQGVNIITGKYGEIIYYSSRKNPTGGYLHKIQVVDGSETKEISDFDLSTQQILESIINHFSVRFLNEVLTGEQRYVVWSNMGEGMNPKHLAWVEQKLQEFHSKKESAENGVYSKTELKRGDRNFHNLTLEDGTEIRYAMFRDVASATVDEITGEETIKYAPGERWSAYIVAHRYPGTKKWINYLSSKSQFASSDEDIVRDLEEKKVGKKHKVFRKGLNVDNHRGALRDGYWRAQGYRWFSAPMLSNGEADHSYRPGDWADFKYSEMSAKIQGALEGIPPNPLGSKYPHKNFLETIEAYRKIFEKIWNMLEYEAEYNNRELKELFGLKQWPNGTKSSWFMNIFTEAFEDPVKAAKKQAELLKMFTFTSPFWINFLTGELHTWESTMMKPKEVAYFPQMFTKSARIEQLQNAITGMDSRIRDARDGGATAEKIAELVEQQDSFKDQYQMLVDPTFTPDPTRLNPLSMRNPYGKHRSQWTDPSMRRKDENVIFDYINSAFANAERNKVLIRTVRDLADIYKANKKLPEDIYDWYIKRLKMAMGDDDVTNKVHLLGKDFDLSSGRVAEWLNKKYPGNTWNADDANRLIRHWRGLITSLALGPTTAMINRSQVINAMMTHGWHYYQRAVQALAPNSPKREEYLAILERIDVANVSHVFLEQLARMSELGPMHASGLKIPFLPTIPSLGPKGNITDLVRMMFADKNAKENFIENGLPGIDVYLQRIIINQTFRDANMRIAEKEKTLKEKLPEQMEKGKPLLDVLDRSLQKRVSEVEREKIKAAREAFLDILMTPASDNTAENLTKKFRTLLGDVGDAHIRAMVNFKMTWTPDPNSEALFTVTQSEVYMRQVTALMELFAADDRGELASNDTKPIEITDVSGKTVFTVPSRFVSDRASEIAHNAIMNTMFGLDAINQGDAFLGAGSVINLYKSYTINQAMHDWNIISSFVKSNGHQGYLKAYLRMQKAMAQVMAEIQEGTKGVGYTKSKHETIDPDALRMARFMLTRGIASTLGPLSSFVPFLRQYVSSRNVMDIFAMTMGRGAETPLMPAMLTRFILKGLFLFWMDDDDRKTSPWTDAWNLFRFFAPASFFFPATLMQQWLTAGEKAL